MGYIQCVSFAFTCLDDALPVPSGGRLKISKNGYDMDGRKCYVCRNLVFLSGTVVLFSATEVLVMCKTAALPLPTKCNGSVLLPSVTRVKAQSTQVQCIFS